jgi:cupin 2 domain-containing protein
MTDNNIFSALPSSLEKEVVEQLLSSQSVRIERIISHGHTAPEEGWYDQDENEWVMVLTGSGTLLFEDGKTMTLETGDYLYIPAHQRHRVIKTAADTPTVWLAVFFH